MNFLKSLVFLSNYMAKTVVMQTLFTKNSLNIIKNIPEGRVLTYGKIAYLAGNKAGARQVSRLLHSMSKKHNLPWHRVVNASGKISLKPSRGYEFQKALLESEGIEFSINDKIDLSRYLWNSTDNI